MKAMILCAGRGERLRPLTDTVPKPLVEVGGVPLVGWHLRRLVAAGIREIVINHAHLGEQIESTLGDGKAYGAKITYSPETAGGLETAGGIATALPLLGEEPFMVINGDIFTDYPFAALAQHRLKHHFAHLVLVPNPLHHPTGDFLLTGESVRPAQEGETSLTFAGIGLYHPRLFATTLPHEPAKLGPLLKIMSYAEKVTGECWAGHWLDVGTYERLAEARSLAHRLARENPRA